jgi:hypothetical protein
MYENKKFCYYLPDIGTLSADELLAVRPLVKGEEIRLGADVPKPTAEEESG